MMRLNKYDRAARSGFDVPKPRLADFGFPNSFLRNPFEGEHRAAKEKAAIKAFLLSIMIAAAVAYVVFQRFTAMGKGDLGVTKFYVIAISGTALWLSYNFIKSWFVNVLHTNEGVQRLAEYDAAIKVWEAKCEDWMESKLETGLLYWQEKRGVAFEYALMRLFQKRGCEVETTKFTGDGGIDLIVKVGGRTFWCQCKGHAKPVSVAPIREIAGVCSTGQAAPVILAVNGYTKPAIETANSLGVRCLDAHDLCKFARLEIIASLN